MTIDNDFARHFASPGGPSAQSIRTNWNRLFDAWRTYENVESGSALFPRNIICALLYMLHVELHYPNQKSSSRSQKGIQISWQRWQLVTRFDVWISCSCREFVLSDCQREWNFVLKNRLSRGPSSVSCAAIGINKGPSCTGPSSMGQRINKDNGNRFFSARCQQFPLRK